MRFATERRKIKKKSEKNRGNKPAEQKKSSKKRTHSRLVTKSVGINWRLQRTEKGRRKGKRRETMT